jgi:NifB/MoaA-like Fe-S oxidoreductase
MYSRAYNHLQPAGDVARLIGEDFEPPVTYLAGNGLIKARRSLRVCEVEMKSLDLSRLRGYLLTLTHALSK